jgi:hypothetical protein
MHGLPAPHGRLLEAHRSKQRMTEANTGTVQDDDTFTSGESSAAKASSR